MNCGSTGHFAVGATLLRGIALRRCRYRWAPIPGRYQATHIDEHERPRIGFAGTGPGRPFIARSSAGLAYARCWHDSYLQPFPVPSSPHRRGEPLRLHPGRRPNRTEARRSLHTVQLFLAASPVKGQAVFAGYGITAPEYNYDDYAGSRCPRQNRSRARHEPQEFESSSVFEGRSTPSIRSYSARR